MKYHTLFLLKIRKMLQNLSSATVVIGALRVNFKQMILILSSNKGTNELTSDSLVL